MNKRDKIRIKNEYCSFLERALGKSPSRKDMLVINKKMNDLNKLSKKTPLYKQKVKNLYNRELSRFWKKIVAYENKGDEINILLKNVTIPPNSKMASIASGIGLFEMFLAKKLLVDGRITCVDYSKSMNAIAEDLLKKLKLKNVSVITASATKIPINSHTQNIVLARRTGLSSTFLWNKVLLEVSRIIIRNPDSRFIYTVQSNFNKPEAKVKQELCNVGLELIKIDSFKEKDGDVIKIIFAKTILSSN